MNNKLWFRAKRYGYGWTPNTWQGWGVMVLYLFALIGLSWNIRSMLDGDGNLLVNFVFPFAVLTFFLIIVCIMKGEKARWRWGKDK
ncbi:MAG: hypothetical protein V4469_01775 [Patescibacteria group bacterium]